MRNSFKVAKWEMKRNMKNKSFIIGLFLTPILFLVFSTFPLLLDSFKSEPDPVTVYVKDELNIWSSIEEQLSAEELNWKFHKTEDLETNILTKLKETENAAYIHITEKVLATGTVNVYMSEGVDSQFINEARMIEGPLRQLQFERLNLSTEEVALISKGVIVEGVTVHADLGEEGSATGSDGKEGKDPIKRIVPGAFAGIILFSIVITGMMIFQSASQEKKEKVAEIVLSSLTPEELMNGKIIGYFGLGIVQVFIWLLFIIPIVTWRFDFPVMEYLLVPELLLLLFIAFSGYLLFAAIFVGIGATVEDLQTAGNFQGIVMMLPFIPAFLIGPVISDPSGVVAKIASYVPVSSPGILLLRLSILDEWPWVEIIIAIVILLFSIWIFMKLAGKIFKTGILMYGKNASPQEIWRWIRQ